MGNPSCTFHEVMQMNLGQFRALRNGGVRVIPSIKTDGTLEGVLRIRAALDRLLIDEYGAIG